MRANLKGQGSGLATTATVCYCQRRFEVDLEQALNLSIENAPEDVVRRLRERAARHRRSLQGELLAIIAAAAREDRGAATASDILEDVRQLGLATPDEATAIIRDDRDGRQGR